MDLIATTMASRARACALIAARTLRVCISSSFRRLSARNEILLIVREGETAYRARGFTEQKEIRSDGNRRAEAVIFRSPSLCDKSREIRNCRLYTFNDYMESL